ncbi:MAG: ferritin-like domain-containing protein [Actinomycetia bacterium]|nr:ferritin-like domain-containing protein [Actinomycetes bacterium]
MRKMFPAEELARDSRFVRYEPNQSISDPRRQGAGRTQGRLDADSYSSAERARGVMHGILVGEIQALEGAGRTCWDFEVGDGPDQAPYELKLDMARQAWDEARHCEISVKLAGHMGSEIGEFAESTFLYEAACHPDPVLRLAGANRALEGLAIDVSNTMREFGVQGGDPVLTYCEDWMLADEVTHVKMGSNWLRRLTDGDPERRKKALEFQRVVDKLFSFNGLRGEEADSPVQLARRFRELAGFSTSEIDDIADMSTEARAEMVVGTPDPS